jgi:hypothetical protein
VPLRSGLLQLSRSVRDRCVRTMSYRSHSCLSAVLLCHSSVVYSSTRSAATVGTAAWQQATIASTHTTHTVTHADTKECTYEGDSNDGCATTRQCGRTASTAVWRIDPGTATVRRTPSGHPSYSRISSVFCLYVALLGCSSMMTNR